MNTSMSSVDRDRPARIATYPATKTWSMSSRERISEKPIASSSSRFGSRSTTSPRSVSSTPVIRADSRDGG